MVGIKEHPLVFGETDILFSFDFDAEEDFPIEPKQWLGDYPIKEKTKRDGKRISDEVSIILRERLGIDIGSSEIVFKQVVVYESSLLHERYSIVFYMLSLLQSTRIDGLENASALKFVVLIVLAF